MSVYCQNKIMDAVVPVVVD